MQAHLVDNPKITNAVAPGLIADFSAGTTGNDVNGFNNNGTTWSGPVNGFKFLGTTPVRLGASTGAGNVALASFTPLSANYTLVAPTVVASRTGDVSLIVRAVDASNYYLAVFNYSVNYVAIYKSVGGAFTLLKQTTNVFAAGEVGATNTLSFTVQGSGLIAKNNGAILATVSDGTYAAAGKIGLRNGGSHITTTSEGMQVNNMSIAYVPAPVTTIIKIYADGDSVTAYPDNYTGFYASDIMAAIPNVTVNLSNVAVSGQSQAAMLADMQAQILAHNPDILTLSTYLNDIGTAATTLTANIHAYIDNALAHVNPNTGLPPQLLLMTDNLAGQTLTEPWARPIAIQESTHAVVLAAYKDYAGNPNIHIIDHYADFYSLGVDTPGLFSKLLVDQVHPNAAGYAIFHANITAPLLEAAARVVAGAHSAPLIYAQVSSAATTTCSIAWATDKVSSSRINYGLTVAYGTTTPETDLTPRVAAHRVDLSNLMADTTYHYQIVSTDSVGNTATSSDQTFTTRRRSSGTLFSFY